MVPDGSRYLSINPLQDGNPGTQKSTRLQEVDSHRLQCHFHRMKYGGSSARENGRDGEELVWYSDGTIWGWVKTLSPCSSHQNSW